MTASSHDKTLRIPTGNSFTTLLKLPTLRLRCVGGPDAGHEWNIEAHPARIGSGPGLEITVSDPTVSRLHARLFPTARGWMIQDQESTNGVLLEGVRVTGGFLEGCCQVTLGGTVFEVQPGRHEILAPPSVEPTFHGMLGSSTAMRELFGLARRVATMDVSVLINGPTGCGKGALARAVHASSPRSSQPFAVLDCANLSGDLVRAELFGHEKGAFTGADQARPGIFEAARGGTVFLDEIGELPLDVQPRLLHALEDRTVCRMGSHRPIDIDVRLVAATHRSLSGMVAGGRFREDLFYRLAVVELDVPPLSARHDDLEGLIQHFLDVLGQSSRWPLPEDVMQALRAHPWPGNVRELRNAVERSVALAGPGPVRVQDLRLAARPPLAPGVGTPHAPQATPSLIEVERQAIAKALEDAGGQKTEAARRLGIDRGTLRRRMRELGLADHRKARS